MAELKKRRKGARSVGHVHKVSPSPSDGTDFTPVASFVFFFFFATEWSKRDRR